VKADSACSWLVKKSIARRRVQEVGYGESQLINGCNNGSSCADHIHRENRRTEFTVLEGPEVILIDEKELE